jgi:hypothetical protein
MTHKKHEIAVFIENEEMLREARELLEKYGENTSKYAFYLTYHFCDFLYYNQKDNNWVVGDLGLCTQTTLPQLEEILKNQ